MVSEVFSYGSFLTISIMPSLQQWLCINTLPLIIWKFANIRKQDSWWFRRAASLTGLWPLLPPAAEPEAATDGGLDEAAVCTEGMAPAVSLTRSWLQSHPVLASKSHPELHRIAGEIMLLSKMSSTHDRICRNRRQRSLFTCTERTQARN